jgi:biopolymer transport protein ExbB
MTIRTIALRLTAAAAAIACLTAPVAAQDAPQQPASPAFGEASSSVEKRLADSLAELAALRERIAAEKVPLGKKLADLEAELSKARQDFQGLSRVLAERGQSLSNLQTDIKARKEESSYLLTLFGDYLRNFESGLHIAELQVHRAVLDAAKLAGENNQLTAGEILDAKTPVIVESIDRLVGLLDGLRFEGKAVDKDGTVRDGTFVLVGPSALFRASDGSVVGTAEQRLGSLEPTIMAFSTPEDVAAASQVASTGSGGFPFDPSLGNAHKVEATQETLWEHIKKGGPVMVPIFVLAGAAFLVVVYKWLGMAFIRIPSQKRLKPLLSAIAQRDRAGALRAAKSIGGPTGRMLVIGVEHLDEPSELVEEVMYEEVLSTRLRLNRMLPFVAICASAAPLLGLLGTVTGIMNTFTLITVFGTGDVKTLSSGISEALITTEYGLIVAIPSLLLHAFLSRKAKGVVDSMEKSALAFLNQVNKTPHRATRELEAVG